MMLYPAYTMAQQLIGGTLKPIALVQIPVPPSGRCQKF